MDLEQAREEWERALEADLITAAKLTHMLRSSEAPEWTDARLRLEAEGVEVDQAALATWHSSGRHSSSGLIGTPEGRVFDFDVVYDYDSAGRPVEKGLGWIETWDERTDKAKIVEKWNLPNLYLTAVIVARRLAEGGP